MSMQRCSGREGEDGGVSDGSMDDAGQICIIDDSIDDAAYIGIFNDTIDDAGQIGVGRCW